MEKTGFKHFLKDKLFGIILLSVAAAVSCGGRIIQTLETKIARNKSEATHCFGGDLVIYWNAPRDYKKSLEKVCRKMEKSGAWPLDKVRIDIESFEKCNEAMKKKTACYAYFERSRENERGYGLAEIYLPANDIKDRETRESYLAHELAHALVSKMGSNITRTVDEFFAIYAQFKLSNQRVYFSCDGKHWNQAALATERGGYPFPPDTNNKYSMFISSCRYGNLEYLAISLNKKVPALYGELWKRLKKHRYGVLDPEMLKDWIGNISGEAKKMISRAYSFQKTDKEPHLSAVYKSGEYCFFIYLLLGYFTDDFVKEARLQIDWWRGGKRVAAHFNIPGAMCWDANKVRRGDTFFIRTTARGKELYRVFIAP